MSGNILNDKRLFQRAFLLLLVVAVSLLFFTVVRRFILTILLAAIFSGLMSPVYGRCLRLFRARRALASAVTLLVMLLVVVVPLGALFTVVADQAIQLTNAVGPWIQQQARQPDQLMQRLEGLPFYEHLAPYREEILTRLGRVVGSIGSFAVSSLSSMTMGTVNFLFHAFLLLYAMFYFLMDGGRIVERIMYYSPLETAAERRLIGKFVSVARATIKGTLVIGIIQGAGAGVALGLAGIHSAVFWSVVMAVLSVIPGVGTALVWVPAVVYLFATGHIVAAIVVAAWCALVVGSVDNLLRPRLVGKDTQMHDLLILFSTLGGLMAFGVSGFIIGPIVAALFVAIWDLYGVTFKDVLPETGE
jgi:predicted PurR-regulated permease PerM